MGSSHMTPSKSSRFERGLRVVAPTLALAIGLTACGGDKDNVSAMPEKPATTVEATTPTAPETGTTTPTPDTSPSDLPEKATAEADPKFAFLDSLSPEEFTKQPAELRAEWAQGKYEEVWETSKFKYASSALAASLENPTDPEKRYLGHYLLAGDQTKDNGQEILNRVLAEFSAVYTVAEHGDWDNAVKLANGMVYNPSSPDGEGMVSSILDLAREHYDMGEHSSTKIITHPTDLRSVDDGKPGEGLIDIKLSDGTTVKGREIVGNQRGSDADFYFAAVTLSNDDTKLMLIDIK